MSATTPAVSVAVSILGPLSLHVDGEVVEVPGKRRRAMLATLAAADGRTVGAVRLIDVLWPDAPPEDAVQALYSHVSRLRRQLGSAAGRLRRDGGGYALELAAGELDAARARQLAGQLDAGTPEEVVVHAREALELWRGIALEEFRDFPPSRRRQ